MYIYIYVQCYAYDSLLIVDNEDITESVSN